MCSTLLNNMYPSKQFLSFVCILVFSFFYNVDITLAEINNIAAETNLVTKYFDECYTRKLRLSCFVDKTSLILEKAVNLDIPVAPGLTLIRSNSPLKLSGREEFYGLDRLISSISKFVNSHSLNVDIGNEARRKRRRRYGFLLSALLGAFGITNAMILKTLAVISGKALLASKMALLIIGIIGLKKMFSKEGYESPVVQVHTLHDEHDRNINTASYHIRNI